MPLFTKGCMVLWIRNRAYCRRTGQCSWFSWDKLAVLCVRPWSWSASGPHEEVCAPALSRPWATSFTLHTVWIGPLWIFTQCCWTVLNCAYITRFLVLPDHKSVSPWLGWPICSFLNVNPSWLYSVYSLEILVEMS